MEMGSHDGQWRVAKAACLPVVTVAEPPPPLMEAPADDPADGSSVALGGIPSSLSRLGAVELMALLRIRPLTAAAAKMRRQAYYVVSAGRVWREGVRKVAG